ncbi:DUF2911 domain-containing protein [Pseudochryseolinea flava]|uniref:DUF2911 domain-containing protein n=1 Tax=Pseudochryseolinea flava TaxID=2059302 RepID=A0A364Y8D0_9BACT|nr:DUF2911 domain-containing protein [Pseudochryseolinea flava]RAW03200.1 hypothetical protein DQQ10_03690 [Pseudochryseolinea flava]
MKKFLTFSAIAIAIIVVLAGTLFFFMRKQTKSYSPEESATYADGDLKIDVIYNRPFKKNRDVFGALVPFDTVWRTGANEATTFETTKELKFDGKTLPKGKYSLWTIPRKDSWTIIFNSEFGQWGVNFEGQANRDAARDVLKFDVPVLASPQPIEQFTISFEKTGEDAEMVLIWDTTLVAAPFSY